MGDSSLIEVAIIVSAHGLRGQVKLRSFTENPEDIFRYNPLQDEQGKRHFQIKRSGGNPPLFIIDVEGIKDRNEAERLKGTRLFANSSQLPEKKENQWYHGELIGLEARCSDGATYGKVIAIHNFGAGDIIELEIAEGKTEMLPFTKNFIGDIAADKSFLTVYPPEYLEADAGDE